MPTDPRVLAIRADPKVGKGSCSSIDECWEDQEILEALEKDGVESAGDALKWAYEQEGLFLEQATNARWGEDNDPQLKSLQEWRKG